MRARRTLVSVVILALALPVVVEARPPMGRVGGGGARPAGPQMSRPAPQMQRPQQMSRPAPQMQRPQQMSRPAPQMQRPQQMARPSMPQMQRPQQMARPSMPQQSMQRPGMGMQQRPAQPNFQRPGMPGGMANMQRPSLPSAANRPMPQVGQQRPGGMPNRPGLGGVGPGMTRPAPQPGLGGGTRPGGIAGQTRPAQPGNLGGLNRPSGLPGGLGGGNASRPGGGFANRPGQPGAGQLGGSPMTRPSFPQPGGGIGANRPTTGAIAGGGNRPGGIGPGGATTLPGQIGGGNRPGGIGGGNRPGLGGGDRPSLGGMTKPFPQPGGGLGGGNRPGGIGGPGGGGPGGATTLPGQVGGGNRPGGGGNRPGGIGGPGGGGPGGATTLPGQVGGGNRPGGGGNRPGGIGGPGSGGPGGVTTLPGQIGGGNRPGGIGGGNRPGIGGGNRPGTGDVAGGGNRPGIGGNRPGINGDVPTTKPWPPGGRPGGGGRPGEGGFGNGGWNQGGRPGIGGNRPGWNGNRPNWNNRPGWNGNGNNIGNNVNINNNNINTGGWGGGYYGGNGWGGGGYYGGWNGSNWASFGIGAGVGALAGWGLGGGWGYGGYGGYGYPGYGGYASAWNSGFVNPSYDGWYNGCWGNGWATPLAFGAASLGMTSMVNSWGLGSSSLGYATSYANPYYVAEPAVAAASPYDYSQPIVVNNYITSDGGDASNASPNTAQGGDGGAGSSAAQISPAQAEANKAVDEALGKFKQGDYPAALAAIDRAVKSTPNDTVLHEVRALSLFALGRYPEAAATLNAVLAVAPGMDWTTMSGLYGSVDTYTGQLRKLEDFCRSNPADAAGHFVLAYHYLVGGHADLAAEALKVVVAKQPGDIVSKRLLESLTPPAAATAEQVPAPAESAPAPQAEEPSEPAGPETDLVGTWKAVDGGNAVVLTIGEDSSFSWKAAPEGKPAVEIKGTLSAERDAIALETESQGTMVAKVTSKGNDAFDFIVAGAPKEAKPLEFKRQK